MKHSRLSAPAIGGSSLLTIFAVLCLTVMALLCLGTAQADRRLSDTAADAVAAYYAADLEAEKIYARLRRGETVEGTHWQENCVMYTVSLSESQTLEVELEKTEAGWQVRRWQTVAKQRPLTETLPVYGAG